MSAFYMNYELVKKVFKLIVILYVREMFVNLHTLNY